ncbi:NADH-quinone oxidoreductase subunit L [Beijerinckia sp. L45]|uniref:NADH-quinone oxidoreductase subunit L n=1 Tax=Beijerinckia sp. L45 TaxID=1641855 RepID=UPI00131C5A99|nr:NADH-quinone oxidoreductase subunit L [Beijerinckia sp. L45]
MITVVVALPLLGFLIAGLFGKQIGVRASELVTTTFLMVSAVLSWVLFIQHALGSQPESVSLITNWFTVGAVKVDWALRVDALTAVMLVVVNTVSALVHLYSMGYMHEDPARPRFFAYLSLFTFAMLMLVTADNLVQMFFGWEGVGLASYLLIGFWYYKPSANAAAIKAFVVNRVGDFGFLLGIFTVFMITQSVSFETIFASAPGLANKSIHVFGHDFDAMTVACLLLFMGAMGKSAQFLLHTWLPDAMEGPTPVSALIHAATMVTAGVFMVARLSPLFEQAPIALAFVTIVGATTCFFAATIGCVQNDIKRVIAYSTCSQLGYMFVGLGVGGYGLGVFHLFTHAFFKALLFLCAGSVIHAMHHEQDMRHMGGLRTKIPVTFWTMLIGTCALVGFPLTSGYFSKDAIIEAAFASHRTGALYAYVLTTVAVGLTSFYSFRLTFMTFCGAPRWQATHGDDHAIATHDGHDAHASHDDHHAHALDPHESPKTMLVPLLVLSVGALFAGAAFSSHFIGESQAEFWKGAIFYGPDNHILHDMEEVPVVVKWIPMLLLAGGFLVACYGYLWRPSAPAAWARTAPGLYRFVLNKWYFDELYDVLFVKPAFWIGRVLWHRGDQGIIDRFGPDGVSASVVVVTRQAVKLQSGYIYHYAFAMLIGVTVFITWYLVGGVR